MRVLIIQSPPNGPLRTVTLEWHTVDSRCTERKQLQPWRARGRLQREDGVHAERDSKCRYSLM